METTRLGISIGAIGTILYLSGMCGGIIPVLLIAGYILLFEKNPWIKRSAVKAVVFVLCFTFVDVLINMIPNAVYIFQDLWTMCGGYLEAHVLPSISDILSKVWWYIETIYFMILIFGSVKLKSTPVPFVDKFVDRHFAQMWG